MHASKHSTDNLVSGKMLTISSFFPIQQVFRVLHLNDFVSPPRKRLGNMRTETLKTSSDNNMYLPSPVSGEFTFSKVVVTSWNLTWMKSKRDIYSCLLKCGRQVQLRDTGRIAWCVETKHSLPRNHIHSHSSALT